MRVLVYLHDGMKDAFNDDCTTISENFSTGQLCLCPLDRFRQVPVINGIYLTSRSSSKMEMSNPDRGDVL